MTQVGPKYAVYRHDPLDRGDVVDGFYWLVDTGVGGTWSVDVDEAQWFDSPDDAKAALYACDIVERGHDCEALGYSFPRVK